MKIEVFPSVVQRLSLSKKYVCRNVSSSEMIRFTKNICTGTGLEKAVKKTITKYRIIPDEHIIKMYTFVAHTALRALQRRHPVSSSWMQHKQHFSHEDWRVQYYCKFFFYKNMWSYHLIASFCRRCYVIIEQVYIIFSAFLFTFNMPSPERKLEYKCLIWVVTRKV